MFDYHPELADTPYAVQLRNLGTLLTSDRQFPSVGQFESTPSVWYFPETQHSLAYGFLNFWLSNDGLRNFGFPISEEITEDGFTVQYFERARFEYHPEFAGTPYEVELGLLGSQYVSIHPLPDQATQAEPDPATGQQSPSTNGLVTLGWWGTVTTPYLNARSGPSTSSSVVGWFSQGMTVKVLEEVHGEAVNPGNDVWYKVDGGRYPGSYIYSGMVQAIAQPTPPAVITVPAGVGPNEVWVDVDLTRMVLTLMEGNKPVFVTYVAIGTSVNPTVVGTFRIWVKHRYTDMVGQPPQVQHAYDLPNVPWVEYFYNGWGLHGTYWHDNFISQRSAGCVNLTIGDAAYIFGRTSPTLPPGQNTVYPSASQPGTVVVTHY
ncbi:MAG: L,D-transpeptidase family protein [Chloroflexi bacterium]|nr:L,D-transpeptidase family protein [Chloroflexota bacterium]